MTHLIFALLLFLLATGFAVLLGVCRNDLDRNAAKVGVRIVALAAVLIPKRERRACVEEWTDDVLTASEDGQGVRPLVKAFGIAVLGAPLLAVLIRYDPQRRSARR